MAGDAALPRSQRTGSDDRRQRRQQRPAGVHAGRQERPRAGRRRRSRRADRRYCTSISLNGYAELMRGEEKNELADHYEKLATLMPGPVVGEAWIDDEEIVHATAW